MPLNSSKFLLLLATPLILVSPTTLAAEVISPIANPPVLTQTTEERQVEADLLFLRGIGQFNMSQFQVAILSWEQALIIYQEIADVAGEASSLNNLGNAYRSLGQYESALDFYEQSLAITREISDVAGEAFSLTFLGNAYRSLGQYERAIEFLQQSLVITREIGDVTGEAFSLMELGIAYHSLGQYERALDFYEQSLAIDREIGDVAGEANSLGNLGNAYHSLGQYERALDFYEQSLAIAREIGDVAGEANSLGNLGNAYRSLGQYERAIEFLQQSLVITREIGDVTGEAFSLMELGNAHHSLGQYEKASEFFEQSLAIKREIGDVAGEANSLGNLGFTYRSLGQYERAIEFHEQSLAIFREIGDVAGVAASLNGLGNAYLALGQYEKASDFYEQSLAISREIGDVAGETASVNGLGNAYHSLGEYERALEFHEQSLAISREIGDVAGEANSLGSLGNAYHSLGQYEKASDFHQQSLAISREIGDVAGEAVSLISLGNAYFSLGQYERAIDFFEQSLAIAREIGDVGREAYSLGNLGNAYLSLGQYERAIEFLQQSLVITREIGDVAGESNSLAGLGNAYRSLGQYERAIDFYEKSLAITREIGDVAGVAASLNNLGNTYLKTENFAAAEQHLFAAIEASETLRADLTNDEDKISIFETQARSYRLLQRALIAQNKTETALEISERGRTRAFVELMAQRSHGDAAEAFVPPAPPTLADIQQVARTQNTTLVEYSVVSFKDLSNTLYIWVIQPTGDIAFRQVNLDSLETPLAQLVTQSRATIGVRNPAIVATYPSPEEIAARQTRHLQQLHQLLIEPIADLLPANPESPVVFIPHDSLFLVPFPALINADGEYLIQNHTILTAPSIQVLELTGWGNRAGEAGGEVLVVGNPTMPSLWNPETDETQRLSNLPGAQSEAVAIAELFETQPLLGDNATETSITERMSTAQIIHLATHGLLDYGIPEETGVRDFPGAIALAQGNGEDGLLTSAELLEMNLNAELVILSACDTGRGKLSSDGVIGLSRALIGAGVESVMVSLWAVPDAPTADLMVEFYQQWQGTGNKAQALRQAMLTTIETHPEPRNWAAFTLMGQL